jgi:pimeloyl-ACP methyl ester carboxylesterase
LLNKIQIPVKVIVGTKDEYFHPTNPKHTEEAAKILEDNIKECEVNLINDAGHQYIGYEDVLAKSVLEFISD